IDEGPVEAGDGSFWYAVSAETGDGTITGWVTADSRSVEAVVVPPPFFDHTAASGVPVYLNNSGESLNVRTGPSLSADVATLIAEAAQLEILAPEILDEDGIAWSLVRYDDVVGYSAAAYLGGAATEAPSL